MKKLSFLLLLFSLSSFIYGQNYDTLIAKGDAFYNKEEYTEAINYFSKAIKVDPKLAAGYEYRADAYKEMKKYEEAIKDYTEAMAIETHTWYYRKRGFCYLKTEKLDLAEKDFNKGIELSIYDNALWIIRGDLYMLQNKKDLACSDYHEAYKLNKSGKDKAKEIGCDWVKSLASKPCPTKPYSVSKTEVDPFTGAIVISKGMYYNKLEIVAEEGGGYVTGPYLGKESFKLKLLEPRNFCADEDGNVFTGIGFSMYDDKDSLLGEAADLYKDTKEGMPLEYLKSLSMTLGFTDTNSVKINKKYLLKIRFFDKRGTAEASMVFPFTMAEHTEINHSISSSQSSLGTGIIGGYIGAEIKKLTIIQTKTKEVTNHFKMAANTDYKIKFDELKNLGTHINYTLRVVDAEGKIVREENAKTIAANASTSVNFSTTGLPLSPAGYTVWVKLIDGSNNSIGVSIPVFFK